MKFLEGNRIAPDGAPRLAASHLGLFCLPISHKRDARLIWVNKIDIFILHALCIMSYSLIMLSQINF